MSGRGNSTQEVGIQERRSCPLKGTHRTAGEVVEVVGVAGPPSLIGADSAFFGGNRKLRPLMKIRVFFSEISFLGARLPVFASPLPSVSFFLVPFLSFPPPYTVSPPPVFAFPPPFVFFLLLAFPYLLPLSASALPVSVQLPLPFSSFHLLFLFFLLLSFSRSLRFSASFLPRFWLFVLLLAVFVPRPVFFCYLSPFFFFSPLLFAAALLLLFVSSLFPAAVFLLLSFFCLPPSLFFHLLYVVALFLYLPHHV
ncbi:unnamed protein product [Plutella xylostella]|uniref:(diamondback moth) hypothetical protein n=1 Tax=Plutella xylostella TaxID=51655 RepID=A0A8S4G330_PLUXY|nr:unnamed protein product [Plutella xylostella]